MGLVGVDDLTIIVIAVTFGIAGLVVSLAVPFVDTVVSDEFGLVVILLVLDTAKSPKKATEFKKKHYSFNY